MKKPMHVRQQILKQQENEIKMKEWVEHIDKMHSLRELHFVAKQAFARKFTTLNFVKG
jgi:hypothetical protein